MLLFQVTFLALTTEQGLSQTILLPLSQRQTQPSAMFLKRLTQLLAQQFAGLFMQMIRAITGIIQRLSLIQRQMRNLPNGLLILRTQPNQGN